MSQQFKIGFEKYNASSITVPSLTQLEIDDLLLPIDIGTIVYNLDTASLIIYNGVSWEDVVVINDINSKQDTLVSGTNIKTVDGVTILGSGDIDLDYKLDTTVFEEQNEITKEPTGYPNRNDSTFSFDDGTRTFTIEPTGVSFDFWSQGTKLTISSPVSLILPNVTDKYFIYFDNTATLGYSTSFNDTLLNDKIFTATVYYNAITGKGEFVVDERHGLTMDWATHFHLHNAFGTRYYGGFGLAYTLGDGSLDTHGQISLGAGTIADEDIPTTIVDSAIPSAFFEQTLSPIAQIPCVYKLGIQVWQKDVATDYTYKLATGIPQYNLATLGVYTLENVTDGNYFAVWIFATPEITTPIISILGGREDSTLNDAKNNNTYSSIEWGDLPSQEYKILYRLIFQYDTTFTNTNKVALIDVSDLRGSIDATLTSSSLSPVATHSNLIGLSSDDHGQYHNDARGDIRYFTKSETSHFFTTIVITTSVTTTVLTNTSDRVILTGTSTDQIVNLGNASTYAIGKVYTLVSNNAEVVNIVNNANVTLLRLEPYNTVVFTLLDNSTADGVWLQTVTFAPANKGYSYREEFVTGTTTSGMTNWTNTTTGAGAGSTSTGTLNGRRSVYQLSTGTTNTGRVAFAKSSNGTLFGNNIMFCYETQIYITTLSTAGERYLWTCGYGDNIVVGDHLDGVYFEYDESLSGNFWKLKTANNGTRTTTVTLVPVVAGSWIKLRIEVNRAGTEVLYFINGQFVGNITTNIPTGAGRNTDLLYKINKTVGNVARTILLDYCNENIYINR
jgi:hypothetical protein